MTPGSAMYLLVLQCICWVAVSSNVDSCIESSCITPAPRTGAAFIQAQSKRGSSTPQAAHASADDPVETATIIPVITRVTSLTTRITALEQKSGEGRESLRSGLDALKSNVDTVEKGGDGSVEHTRGRVDTLDGQVATLEGVVNQQNADLRTEMANLKSEFGTLGQRVGQQWSSMFQSWSTRGDPGSSQADFVTQVQALEGRASALELVSGNERSQLKNGLDAVAKQIEELRSGGAGSLDHTTDRVSSAEKQLGSLSDSVDAEGSDMKASLAVLRQKLDGLGRSVGSLLSNKHEKSKKKHHSGSYKDRFGHGQANQDDPAAEEGSGEAAAEAAPAAPAQEVAVVPSAEAAPAQVAAVVSSAGGEGLPLTTRVSSLETRVQLLEEKSEQGRGELQIQLDTLSTELDTIKEGGVKSLAHTILRVGTLETELDGLTGSVETQKSQLMTEMAELKAMVDGLNGRVGA